MLFRSPQPVSLSERKDLPDEVVRQAFRLNPEQLPAYAGVENPEGGFTLLRVSRVAPAENIAPEKRKGFRDALRQVLGERERAAYLASIRQNTEIQVNRERLEQR